MTESIDYFELQHQRLLDDYVIFEENGALDNCVEKAIKIAGRLLGEGHDPQILYVTGAKIDEVSFERLIPLPYGGRVVWDGHTVCVSMDDGHVWDPILEKPTQIKHYGAAAFGADIIMRSRLFEEGTLYPALEEDS